LSNSIDSLTGGLPLTSVSDQLARLQAINDMLLAQELRSAQGQTSQQASTGSSGGSLLGTIGSFLGGGLGLAPLIGGLADLFGGGSGGSSITPPVPYLRPLPVQLDAGFSNQAGSATFATDAAQGGLARPVTNAAPAQITVNVQAMDTQSFLDRSGDIAMAVRQAMLESTVLNDVIREV